MSMSKAKCTAVSSQRRGIAPRPGGGKSLGGIKEDRKEMGNEQRCRTAYAKPRNPRAWRKWVLQNPRAWEMEMMHQVWAAGLHDAANCFQDALEAKWKIESQQKAKPKTNSDRIRAMTDEELAKSLTADSLREEDALREEQSATGAAGSAGSTGSALRWRKARNDSPRRYNQNQRYSCSHC